MTKILYKTILHDMHSRVKKVVRNLLSTMKWISLTSDVWPCKVTRNIFFSLIARSIGDNFQRKSGVLNNEVFPGRNTGEASYDK